MIVAYKLKNDKVEEAFIVKNINQVLKDKTILDLSKTEGRKEFLKKVSKDLANCRDIPEAFEYYKFIYDQRNEMYKKVVFEKDVALNKKIYFGYSLGGILDHYCKTEGEKLDFIKITNLDKLCYFYHSTLDSMKLNLKILAKLAEGRTLDVVEHDLIVAAHRFLKLFVSKKEKEIEGAYEA